MARDFYLKNPTPNGSRPSDLIGLYKKWQQEEREEETPTGEKEQQGRGGGRQGLHCGEANPNQRLGGTSGQRPSAGT